MLWTYIWALENLIEHTVTKINYTHWATFVCRFRIETDISYIGGISYPDLLIHIYSTQGPLENEPGNLKSLLSF